MGKSLRLVSINFPFIESHVDHVRSLATPKALFDYDVVVIRPHPLTWLLNHPVSRAGSECWVEGSDFAKVESVVTRAKSGILRLLGRGGLVVVILDSIEVLKWNPYATGHPHLAGVHKISNYDFLDEQFHSCVSNGSGQDVRLVDTSTPFSKVVQNSSVRWTAFLERRPMCPYDNPQIFARNTSDRVIGAVFECAGGHIVTLPNFERLNEQEFLTACWAYRSERQEANPPLWIPSIYLPGEYEANNRITGFQVEIKRLQQKQASELERREELLGHKNLLYQQGRVHLEAAVRNALDLVGFQTTPPEVLPGCPIEISGRIRGVSMPGVLQVGASSRQITCEEFKMFAPKVVEDNKHTQVPSKRVFVGNGFNETPPGTRLGTVIFSPRVVEEAQEQSISLLNSVELYWVVCGVLSKEIDDLERIREAILTTSGYVDLRPFCSIPPFPISQS